jgi:hypothetical protein
MLLSWLHFAGTIDRYLIDIGYPSPQHTNPVDQAITAINTEFYNSDSGVSAAEHLDKLAAAWVELEPQYNIDINGGLRRSSVSDVTVVEPNSRSRDNAYKTLILTRRNFLNYVRNLLAFGIRSQVPSRSSPCHVLTCLLIQWACMVIHNA